MQFKQGLKITYSLKIKDVYQKFDFQVTTAPSFDKLLLRRIEFLHCVFATG
jgi:hypothetical protein